MDNDDGSKGCGGCGGCLPPDDDMKRKKEKEQRLTDWVCGICDSRKNSGNRIFNFEQSLGSEGLCLCNECIENNYRLFKEGKVEQTRPDKVCSFCFNGVRENVFVGLFQSLELNEIFICERCLEDHWHKSQHSMHERNQRMMKKIPSPQEIFGILDQYVIGQRAAKETISVQIHLRALTEGANKVKASNEEALERSNVLLIGPTGCGKTLIMETVRKKMNMVVVTADANSFSESGYFGDDINDIFTWAMIQAGEDLEKAQNAIVFIDEIDKIAAKETKSDVSRGAVQQALLTVLQGVTLSIMPNFNRKNEVKKIQFDTSQIFFVVAGAFSDLAKLIQERESKTRIGFGKTEKKTEFSPEEILKLVGRNDLIKYGFYPEFLGRLHRIVIMDFLTVDDFVRIIREPKNSLEYQWKKTFSFYDKTLEIDEGAIREIASRAINSDSGARGLRGTFDEIMHRTVFEQENDPEEVIGYRLTRESVDTGILEKISKKTCTGNCGANCCQLTGGECCGGHGHDEEEEKKIVISK